MAHGPPSLPIPGLLEPESDSVASLKSHEVPEAIRTQQAHSPAQGSGMMDSIMLPRATTILTPEEIIARMEIPPTPQGADVIRRAYDFAEQMHEGQRRKSGDPYFLHPACVAGHLAEVLSDPATIAAGLLHDVVEDCGVSVEKLASLFPAPVPDLVDGVSKISSLNFSSDKEHQVGNLRKMILAMAKDVRVLIIKLCDRIHNLQTLEHLAPHRQRAIAQSTIDIYAPLANRIGMTRLRAMLEDLSMKFLYPSAYTRLKKKMAVRAGQDQLIIDSTRQMLADALAEHQISASIQGRTKHLYSIYLKMRKGGLTFDEVHDILALRVIADTVAECYEILGIVHSIWKPISGRFKDYIALPKGNGYRSIHTSVIGIKGEVVEIQIRTAEMHHIAEDGIAAHWRYKERGKTGAGNMIDGFGSNGGAVSENDEKRLQWLRSLVEWLKDVRDPNEFMRELKKDVFEASVFCYTPKGDILEMPRGSTALDLAFRIHTQLGMHCSGAKINNRMASIRTELQTGDIIEILTSKNSHPTADWLQVAQTGRARNKIRHYLKESQRSEFLERGHKMLMEQARARFGSNLEEARVEDILKGSFKQFSVDSYEDLMVEVGCGTIKVSSLIGRLETVIHPAPSEPVIKRVPRQVRRARNSGKDVILVEGMAGAITRMARCCSPLPGDPIVGFITQGRGISVHRADCGSLASIQERAGEDGARIVSVEWGDASQALQKAVVRLVCHDRKGLLSDVTGAVTALNVNIIGAHTTSNLRENRAILKLILLIEDADQLNVVLQRLLTVPGVINASRVAQH